LQQALQPFLVEAMRQVKMNMEVGRSMPRADSPPEAILEARAGRQAPRTDAGTLVLHWLTAIAFIVSLFTGIRIAADALIAPVSQWLTPILPQGEIWTWHFYSGLALFFAATAYVFYIVRSGLAQRNATKKTRALLMRAPKEMKWAAVNVILHWFIYALIVVMFATGVILYLGHGSWWVYVHSASAFIGLGYIFVHVVAHYMFGGWLQLLRVFKPARLVITRAVRPMPLLIGFVVAAAAAAAVASTDWGSRDTLTIVRTSQPPKLDGVLEPAEWARANRVVVHTHQGVNLGGTGASKVEIWALRDDDMVYFAFRWEDPTRSMRRVPMIKREDGWHILHDRADLADVNTFYEDKLAVAFTTTPSFGGGDSTHLGTKPLPDKPAPFHGRGYHYTIDNSLVDVWQWKASRGGHLGYVDDQYFGPPREPTEAETAGQARYQAGYWNDPGRAFYIYNYKNEPPGGYRGPVEIVRLPIDWQATVKKLGRFDLDPDSSDEEGSQWWMFENETVPFSREHDAAIPVGTVIPGVLIIGEYEGDRADIRGAAKWKDGHWTLEVARKLRTGSKFDHDFVPGQALYMWLNVFDHTQTRHTRHQRPVRVVLQ
jgi:cytochrome b subunit of formate dehydrogenase